MILGTRKNVTYHNSNKFQFEDALHNLCTLLRLLSHIIVNAGASLVAQTVKNLPAMPETWFRLLGWDSNPLQYSCLENPHGQRSLVGYSPWGRRDTTERPSTQCLVGMNVGIKGIY